jgi:MFS family permease
MFILVVVYTFNFIDRQIVGILAVPIKADLGLTDTQLGLMGGLAFALFYTGLGIPVAMLADRWNRTWIMTAALTVWSAMTAACGLAQNFWQLFLGRLGVGVGEAGGVAPAYSLISDYFPSHQRARALSVYSFGIPIGSALGILFGGYIASKIDWRYAFFAVGLAGIVVAPIFKLTVAEPERGQYDKHEGGMPAPTLGTIFRKTVFLCAQFRPVTVRSLGVLRRYPAYWRHCRGLARWRARGSLRRGPARHVCENSGVRVPHYRAVLHSRYPVPEPDDNVFCLADSNRARAGLAGAGLVGHPARRSTNNAGDRFGHIPVHQ